MTTPEDEPTHEPWNDFPPSAKVIDDPKEIERLRQLFEDRLEEAYPHAIRQVENGEFGFSSDAAALRLSRESVIKDLERILENSENPLQTRLGAASQLDRLGESSHKEFIFGCLDAPDPAIRKSALTALGFGYEDTLLADGEGAKRLFRLMEDEDPEIARLAVQRCQKVPEFAERLSDLVERGDSKILDELIDELARVAVTPRRIRILVPHLVDSESEKLTPKRREQIGSLLLCGDLAEPIREALREWAARNEESRNDPDMADLLALVGVVQKAPLLEKALAGDPVGPDEMPMLFELAATLRGKALEEVYEKFATVDNSHYLHILARRASEEEFERFESLALRTFRTRNQRWLGSEADETMIGLMFDYFGERGRRFVEANLDELDDVGRYLARWKMDGCQVSDAIKELHSLGVLPTAREELAPPGFSAQDHVLYRDTNRPFAIISILVDAGLVAWIDLEPPDEGESPVQQFATVTGAGFHHPSSIPAEDGVLESFVLEGRLFQGSFEDYFDVKGVATLVNFALATVGRRERFIGIHTGDQTVPYVFADPEVFVPFARKYHILLAGEGEVDDSFPEEW